MFDGFWKFLQTAAKLAGTAVILVIVLVFVLIMALCFV